MKTDMLKKEIDELMNIIIDDSPENIPLRTKAKEKLVKILYDSKWIEKQVMANGINPTKGWHDTFQDCVQECWISIFTKCDDYDPHKKVQPMTYLTNILSYTVQDFKKRAMNPGATEHYSNLANKVRGALASMEDNGLFPPSTEMVAAYTGMSIQQAEEALTIIRSGGGYDSFIMSPDNIKPGVHDNSFSCPVSIGNSPIMHDPADFMIEIMEQEAVQEELKKIGGQEMEAFLLYYGYGGYENPECVSNYQGVARHIGNISAKEAKKMIEEVKNQLIKNLVCRKLYGADDQ